MSDINKDLFVKTLNSLITSNPHARNKGDEFKEWIKVNFNCDARISHITEQRQTTNRVSEQFRYFAPLVVFVCVEEVKRDTLIQYILERDYDKLECVAIIGEKNEKTGIAYSFEQLIVFKNNDFVKWASSFFTSIATSDELKKKLGISSGSVKRSLGGFNKIYYGCPGCGKSHHVKRLLLDSTVDEENNVFRVTFHQEYSNFDFVGQIIPKVKKITKSDGSIEDNITYEFSKGPFTLALERALSQNEMVYLIIEEINRGNAPAIFGDLFQLLDRVPKGKPREYESEYEINNVNIQKVLLDDGIVEKDAKIYLPSNLTILATMNSSDQNVFTLDTAFKRRWKFEYVDNNFKPEDSIGKLFVPGSNVTWQTFVEKINEKIADQGINDSISDDKRIGKWFVSEELLCDTATRFKDGDTKINKELVEKAKRFAFKILEYLWNDVAKYDAKTQWFDTKKFNTLEKLIEGFVDVNVNNSVAIFGNLF